MAPKTWTAADLALGPLKINRVGTSLHVERRYSFLDGAGDPMPQIKGDSLIVDVEIADLPPNIASALSDIDTWTKNQALIKEGMDG